MVTYIRLLKSSREVKELLCADGWHIEELENGALATTHTQVVNQDDARVRLSRLGLLTSSRLRIKFEPHFTRCATRGTSVYKTHAHGSRFLHENAGYRNRLDPPSVSSPPTPAASLT